MTPQAQGQDGQDIDLLMARDDATADMLGQDEEWQQQPQEERHPS